MRVLFCGGNPKAPSWEMRARQISAHAGWRGKGVINEPTPAEIAGHDVIVVVKRIKKELTARLADCGKPIIWDALDFWPQNKETPVPNNVDDARRMAAAYCAPLAPRAIIAANQQMAHDLQGMAPVVRHIYHHARLDARPCSFAKIAYYDGSENHAQGLMPIIARELKDRGWEFRIGAPGAEGGALIAMRDPAPSSWLARRWKSNVKAANAIAYRLPMVAQSERGYTETMPDDTVAWADQWWHIGNALDWIARPEGWREAQAAYERYDCGQFTLPIITKQYNAIFEAVL